MIWESAAARDQIECCFGLGRKKVGKCARDMEAGLFLDAVVDGGYFSML